MLIDFNFAVIGNVVTLKKDLLECKLYPIILFLIVYIYRYYTYICFRCKMQQLHSVVSEYTGNTGQME